MYRMESYVNKKFVERIFTEDVVNVCNSTGILSANPEEIKAIFKSGVSTQKNKQLMFCLLCAAIYRYDTFFYELINHWGLNRKDFKVVNIDEGSLVYGRYTFEGSAVYFFKGSSSIKDFLVNIELVQTKDSLLYGKIHKGFHNVLTKDSRHLDILKDIFSLPKGTNIYFTGHSLGGALCSLIHCYTQSILMVNTELITFGCPRVGDAEFSKQIKYSNRLVNGNDAVSRLPLPISYRHSEKKQLLGKESYLKFSLSSHSIDSYYNSLSRI